MNPRFQESLHLVISPSLWQQRFILIVHLLAVFAILIASLSILIKAVMILFLLICGFIYLKRSTDKWSKLAIKYSDAAGWQMAVENDFEAVQICRTTVITPWLIVLHYTLANNKHHVPIFCDALEIADFRKLLVLLKVSGLK